MNAWMLAPTHRARVAAGLTALMTMLTTLGAVAPALAQTPPVLPGAPVADHATFAVRVIEAQKGAAQIDPKLADLDRELRALHRDYAKFTLLRTESLSLALNQRGLVRLPNGDLAVQFLGSSGDKAQRVRHRVEMPGMNATVRAIAPGGRTLDVLQVGDKLIILATTVGR